MRRALIAVSLLIGAVIVGGCKSERYRYADTFATNRFATLDRSIRIARESIATAEHEVTAAAGEMGELFLKPEREDAFVASRRVAARARARVGQMKDRVNNVRTNAKDLIDEWSHEMSGYTDDKMKAKSKADLELLQKRWEPVEKALEGDLKAFGPVLVLMDDDVLALKHRRGAGSLPPEPQEPGRYDAKLAALHAWVVGVNTVCEGEWATR